MTANEGDVREYDGLNAAGREDVEVEDIALDPEAFPRTAAVLKSGAGIGKLKVSSFMGNTDGDADYDQLYSFGARSFAIRSPEGELVFDSGDDLEELIKASVPQPSSTPAARTTRWTTAATTRARSLKGITVASLFGRTYIFVMLERIGGVVVYEAGNPAAPTLVQYINTRNFGAPGNTAAAGDRGAEAARVVPAEQSPNGKPLLIVSNEVSGSLRVFEIAAK